MGMFGYVWVLMGMCRYAKVENQKSREVEKFDKQEKWKGGELQKWRNRKVENQDISQVEK